MLGNDSSAGGIFVIGSFFLMARLLLAWYLLALTAYVVAAWFWDPLGNAVAVLGLVAIVFALVRGYAHIRRVRLLGHKPGAATLANRHRRQIEMPIDVEDAFVLVDDVMRQFAHGGEVASDRGGLRLHARIGHLDRRIAPAWRNPLAWFVSLRNQVLVNLAPGGDSTSVILLCEPQCATWSDWFRVDDGANLETAEAISRAIAQRLGGRRREERRVATQTATDKELALARLRLLQAQVEPHFLYNTLANAQVLMRNDPAGAEAMLGHLIDYLRRSLPRTDTALSTLGEELERSRAYLAILKLRMGERLALKIDVAHELLPTPLPPMMLQTLVENAIKHGLEPKPAGGHVWIFARRDDGRIAVTVADDGCGFDPSGGGTGIGLRNVRERLRLLFGNAASLTVAANAPAGVAATISVPASAALEVDHG